MLNGLQTRHRLLALILTACSVGTPVAPPTPSLSPTNTIAAQHTPIAPTVEPPLFSSPSTTPVSALLFPPWAGANLTGHVIFVAPPESQGSLVRLDLASSLITPVFQPPANARATGATVSPDGKHVLITYTPPPSADRVQYYGNTDLYLLPAQCLDLTEGCSHDDLTPLLIRKDTAESYYNPMWSSDGTHIYYTHLNFTRSGDQGSFSYRIERLAFPDGQPEVVIENAIWPRLSPDGSKLAFVSSTTNELFIADADGLNEKLITPSGVFAMVDVPFFSPDGSALIFSAARIIVSSSLSWTDQLLGVQSVSAGATLHNIPSDWYRIPAGGGQPEQLTNIFATNLYGSFTPDGNFIVFVSSTGLFIMQPNGINLTQLINGEMNGTIGWARP